MSTTILTEAFRAVFMQSDYDLKSRNQNISKMRDRRNLHSKAKDHTHLLAEKKDKITETFICYSTAKDDTTFASPIFPGICNASEYGSKKR